MAKFILVRHGEPTYDEVISLGFKGHGIALAPLTKKGIEEVKKTAEDRIFEDSDLLISSPYTRAMQTASIIGKKHNLDINVELLLHEWLPDLNHDYNTVEQFTKNIIRAKKEWEEYKNNRNFKFSEDIEPFTEVKKRALKVLQKYNSNNKVIVVTHGLLISMLFEEKVRLKTGHYIVTNTEKLKKIR